MEPTDHDHRGLPVSSHMPGLSGEDAVTTVVTRPSTGDSAGGETVETNVPFRTPIQVPLTIAVDARQGIAVPTRHYPQTATVCVGEQRYAGAELPFTTHVAYADPVELTVGELDGFDVVEKQPKLVAVSNTVGDEVVFLVSPRPCLLTVHGNVSVAHLFKGDALLGRIGEPVELEPFVNHHLSVRAPGYSSYDFVWRSDEPGQETSHDRPAALAPLGCMVTLDTSPPLRESPATVLVDGRAQTNICLPFRHMVLGEGERTIGLELQEVGWEPPVEQTITTTNGTANRIVFPLRRMARFTVETTPRNALSVLRQGTNQGQVVKSGIAVWLSSGEYGIEVGCKGYRSYQADFQLATGEEKTLDIELKQEGKKGEDRRPVDVW